jgi:hypothetical protein
MECCRIQRFQAWIVDFETWRVVHANEPALRLWGTRGMSSSVFMPACSSSSRNYRAWRKRSTLIVGESLLPGCASGKDGSRFSLSLRWHQADYNGRRSNFVFATEHPKSQ